MDELTPEQLAKISLMRIMLGDVPGSPFYPMLADEEYALILEMNNWDVKRAVRQAGFSILFYLTQVNYRERTGDIEVWNNASIEYRKALNDYLDDSGAGVLPPDLLPWAGGTSAKEVCSLLGDPDYLRHPLAAISHCASWWTRLKNQDCLTRDSGLGGCGCG